MGFLVARNPAPVQRFGRSFGVRIRPDDLAEQALRLSPVLALERLLRDAELQTGEELIGREETFDAVTLFALGIELQDRRGPLRAVALSVAPEIFGLLADVEAGRDELLGDEPSDAIVGISLGIQPSASPSHRGGAEIEQHRTPLLLRLFEHAVDIGSPCDLHDTFLPTI